MTAGTTEVGSAEHIAALLARPVLTIGEAVVVSGLSRSTLIRAFDAGEIGSRKIGRRRVILTASLVAWLTGGDE